MTSFRLLQDGTSKRLLEDGTSKRLLEQDNQVEYRPRVRAIHYNGPTGIDAHIVGCARNDRFPAGTPFATPLIYLPGGGGLETSWQVGTSTNPNQAGDALRAAVDRAYHVRRFVTFPTDYTWGDDEFLTRMDTMLAYAESHYNFSPPYHILGVSMGTLCTLNWAVRNPTKVASLGLMLGMVNPRGFADDGRLTGGTGNPSYEPPVVDPSVAYGGAVPTAYNPLSRASEYAGIPIKMWQSNNDSVCYLSEATTFAASNDAEIVNIGNQPPAFSIIGHGLRSGFRSGDVADFFAAHD